MKTITIKIHKHNKLTEAENLYDGTKSKKICKCLKNVTNSWKSESETLKELCRWVINS